jgi:hypothetical protein
VTFAPPSFFGLSHFNVTESSVCLPTSILAGPCGAAKQENFHI